MRIIAKDRVAAGTQLSSCKIFNEERTQTINAASCIGLNLSQE